MGKLEDVYSSVENPLDNEEMLKKIVEAYSKSSRTSLFGSSDLYSSLVKMNQTKDSSQINLGDREAFMVEAYNQWIENMLSLDDTHIQYLEKSRGMDARQMQQYLRSFGKVSSMDDIKRLKSNPLFDEEINGWELQDGWEHIKSQYISGRTESRIPVKHRLYIGCQNQDMWKLAQLFKSKCEEQQIPFYFKLGSSSERDDKMVIYADTDNLGNYISALQEIAQEHPEIMQRSGEPPALTGKIDGWIGIGDEPPKKENGENQSYNSLRADIFENAIEETILNELSIDIVEILNPELLKQKIELPNGAKIPARQYIQEVVAPHIPSDVKFILKSNGLGLSAKQFIEEAVMFEGQEKYNGDINALLEAMTVANNGTVSVGIKTKAPREQGLQQEIGISQVEAQKKETDEAIRKQEEESQHSMAERNEMRRLQFMGKNLTAEQQKRLTQLEQIYQTNQGQAKQQQGQGIGR